MKARLCALSAAFAAVAFLSATVVCLNQSVNVFSASLLVDGTTNSSSRSSEHDEEESFPSMQSFTVCLMGAIFFKLYT